MTTTTEEQVPEPIEPIAAMEIRRTVSALIVQSASAHAAIWTAARQAVPEDVRIIVEAVDQLGREHHLSLSLDASSALLNSIDRAHQEGARMVEELS